MLLTTFEEEKGESCPPCRFYDAPAKSVYVKLGFKIFKHLAHFVRETNSLQTPENASGVKIREFQKNDLDQVYNLRASEDPNSLRIFDFTKGDLKTPFLQRIFHFAGRAIDFAFDRTSLGRCPDGALSNALAEATPKISAPRRKFIFSISGSRMETYYFSRIA